jgi:superfamily II DNA or RNA helicase
MLELRSHQQEVVDKIEQGFADGHRCQLLYAPTGFGKTEVAMHIMVELVKNYKKAAMVLDRIVLVNQTSTRLSRYDISHGVMMSGHWRYRPYEKIQVCSAQTLESRDNFTDVSLLIIDECHVQRKQIIQFIKDRPEMKVIGLTATPFTNGLGDTYTNVVGARPTGELIENKWLTPLKIYIAKEIDMTGAAKVAGEWSQDETTKRGMKITGDIVQEWITKTMQVFGRP